MSENVNSTLDEQTEIAAHVGQQFRKAREKLGLSQEEVAKQLCFGIKIIDAIENGTFPDIAVPTYVQGYLRNYARCLNLNEAPILESFVNLQKKVSCLKPVCTIESNSNKKAFLTSKKVRWIGYGVIFILSLLVVNRVINQRNSNLKTAETELNVSEGLPAIAESEPDEAIANLPVTETNQNSILSVSEEKVELPTPTIGADSNTNITPKKAKVLKKAKPLKIVPKKEAAVSHHSEIIYRPVSN